MNATQSAEATKRVRRSQEEVRQERLDREARLAQKAQDRKERLMAQVAMAEQRAQKALTRQEQISSNTTSRQPKEALPTIKEPVAKRVQREVATFMKDLGAKHGLNFDGITPRMTRRGSGLSFHIVGTVAGVATAVRRAAGASREAARFMEFHKLVGIKPNILGKEVQLSNETGSFKVLGLKGRAHDVVLQKVGSDDIKTVAVDEFRQRMVTR